MVLDRQYQNDLLSFLLEEYPEYEHAEEHCQALYMASGSKYVGNVYYLQNHGLLENGVSLSVGMSGNVAVGVYAFPEITEKGIDFMLQDGGVGAILNIQTVKLHPDTVKALIEFSMRNLPERDRESLMDRVKSLPEEAAKRLLDKLLDKGIEVLSSAGLNGLLNSLL